MLALTKRLDSKPRRRTKHGETVSMAEKDMYTHTHTQQAIHINIHNIVTACTRAHSENYSTYGQLDPTAGQKCGASFSGPSLFGSQSADNVTEAESNVSAKKFGQQI